MIPLPSTEEFLKWQIGWYTRRLAEETRPEGRSFLRKTLHDLKKTKQSLLN